LEVSGQIWTAFIACVLALLFLDLAMLRRNAKPITMKAALIQTAFWISLGLGVNYAIYHFYGPKPAMEFLAAYILEESLSVDNLFVFLLIFSYFRVPAAYQHRVLFLGVLGALVMRFTFIIVGIELVERFHWLLYVFGAILIYSGLKMGAEDDDDLDPDQNPVVKKARKLFPVTGQYHGSSIFVRINGKLHATPLFIVLVAIETTDLIFAVDSIPAVFGITQDHFVVYSSNVMAILGLRALYFALAGMMGFFRFLRFGLSAILVFIGAKMILEKWIFISTPVALGVIGVTLLLSVLASLAIPARPEDEEKDEEKVDQAS